jgi:two-component system chemotaxis response regulator CheY
MVEDDSFIRQLTTEALSLWGYKVEGAEDGSVAWNLLNAGSYDLMITDNSMPKLTGLELLKKMRAARMALPVIMATGVLPTAEFARSPWLKPAATLVKPYTIAELMGKVNEVLCAAEDARE